MAPRLRCLPFLLLAGCAATGDQKAAALRQAMESSQASLALFAPPGDPVPLPSAHTRAPPQRAGLSAAARRGGTGAPPGSAAELLQAGPETLRQRLGEPTLRRREGTAEVWLYTGEACALDLILYPAAGGLRVAHAAARASGTEPRTEAECLRELAVSRALVAGQGGSPGDVKPL
ncbi:hypothetical protein [Roseicella aquatilis]|uniref:Uncharacterized protein n=1 Tax=Roseicella aquatilis TaxID=2527868 RepID=A0A4R4DD76_9PROT|nr:hypothetical protein [Roseicella aquatilis]TCZ58681.1 hypothetical protein EXY23_15835 [Roseicella aquatilis]